MRRKQTFPDRARVTVSAVTPNELYEGRSRASFDAKLRADATRDCAAVVVSGTTALPDGTLVDYEVWGGYLWGLVLGHRRRGRVRVKDGRFAVRFDPAPWKGPIIDVAVSLRGDWEQPKATRDLIGKRAPSIRRRGLH